MIMVVMMGMEFFYMLFFVVYLCVNFSSVVGIFFLSFVIRVVFYGGL